MALDGIWWQIDGKSMESMALLQKGIIQNVRKGKHTGILINCLYQYWHLINCLDPYQVG